MAIKISPKPQLSAGFVPAGYQRVQVDPNAYGGGGEGLQALGKGVVSVSQSVDHISEQMERDEVKKAVAKYDSAMRAIVTGNAPSEAAQGGEGAPGFVTLQGSDAMQAYQPSVQSLQDLRNGLRAELGTGRAQKLFDATVADYEASGRRMLDQHYQQQQKVASALTAQDASSQAVQNACAFPNDPVIYQTSLRAGPVEAAKAAAMNPDGGKTPEQAAADWTSGFHVSYASVLLDGTEGLTAAEYYVDSNRGEISFKDLQVIEPKLELKRDQEVVAAVTAPLLGEINGWEGRMGAPPAEGGQTGGGLAQAGGVAPIVVASQPQNTDLAASAEEGGVELKGPPEKPLPTHAGAVPPGQAMNQTLFYGLPHWSDLEARYNNGADAKGLTPRQRAMGLASLRNEFAKATSDAREQHRALYQQAADWIAQGNTLDSLSPDIARFLSPRSTESLRWQQEIDHGTRHQETDFSTSLYLGMMPPSAFGKRVVAEDMPYLSPTGRLIVDGIHKMLNSSNPAEVHKGEAYLSVVGMVNYSALVGGGSMRRGRALDSLYIQSIKMVDGLIEKYGVPSDTQLWGAVSPVILDHLESKVRAGDSLAPSRDDRAMNELSRRSGIPVDMILPVWNDIKADPNARPSYEEMTRRYFADPAGIMARAFNLPKGIVEPLIADMLGSGRQPSLAGLMPLWSAQAQGMPASW